MIYWSVTGRSDSSGDVAGLKFEGRARAQSSSQKYCVKVWFIGPGFEPKQGNNGMLVISCFYTFYCFVHLI